LGRARGQSGDDKSDGLFQGKIKHKKRKTLTEIKLGGANCGQGRKKKNGAFKKKKKKKKVCDSIL